MAITLEATKREIIGKQVKQLRAQGVIPGVLYGPEIDAVSLQVPWQILRPVLSKAGGSQIIELNVDGEKYNALVREVQRDVLRGNVLHIDFYHVRMDVTLKTEVPVVLVGDPTVIEQLGGTLLHEMTTVEVECLPDDLPSEIQVSIAGLTAVGDSVLAGALPELPGVTYHVNPEDMIVSTAHLRREEEEEEVEEVEAELDAEEPELIRRREDEEGGEETEV